MSQDPILDKLDEIVVWVRDVAPSMDRKKAGQLKQALRALLAEVAIEAIRSLEGMPLDAKMEDSFLRNHEEAIYERFGVAPPSEGQGDYGPYIDEAHGR